MIIGPRATARLSTGCVSTIFLLVTRVLGWALIGIGLFLGGLIWGLTSHQVSYIQGGQGQYQVYVSDDYGFIYLQQGNTNNYYVMHIPDYTPFADPSTILRIMQSHSGINFIARSDSTAANIELNGVLVTTAHTIEKITFANSNGQNAVTYTSSDYSGNPNGYTANYWPYAAPLMLVGAICAGSMIFIMLRARRRRLAAAAAEFAAIEARPSPFARELAQDAMNAAPDQNNTSPDGNTGYTQRT